MNKWQQHYNVNTFHKAYCQMFLLKNLWYHSNIRKSILKWCDNVWQQKGMSEGYRQNNTKKIAKVARES